MLEPSEVVLQATYEGGKGLRIMGKGLQYGMDVPCNVIAVKTNVKMVSS